MLNVRFDNNHCRKSLKSLDAQERERITAKLVEVLSTFSWRTPNVKKLTAEDGYRIRIGDYRAFFVQKGNDIIVRSIRPRQQAYKKK